MGKSYKGSPGKGEYGDLRKPVKSRSKSRSKKHTDSPESLNGKKKHRYSPSPGADSVYNEAGIKMRTKLKNRDDSSDSDNDRRRNRRSRSKKSKKEETLYNDPR